MNFSRRQAITWRSHCTLKYDEQGTLPAEWNFVWTWKSYYDDCCKFAKTLIHLDVAPYKITNILGFNSVSFSRSAWYVSMMRYPSLLIIKSVPSNIPMINWFVTHSAIDVVSHLTNCALTSATSLIGCTPAWVGNCKQRIHFCKLHSGRNICD